MRISLLIWMIVVLPVAHADVAPESLGMTTLPTPSPTWLIVKGVFGSAYVFDVASGTMKGTLSLTDYTPAVQPNVARGEVYAAERYYSRLHRGDRTDVLTIYDLQTLAPRDEIKLPTKIASLPFRHYINLFGDGRHVAIFNMTPAQSVSIVDVIDKSFVGEISTPGCALTLPSGDHDFLMICGDGTLQLVQLDRRGQEIKRIRSDVFFSVEEDPVFDKPIRTPSGWLLVTFEGRVFEVSVNDGEILIGEPWSIVSEEDLETSWRVGGGQIVTLHRDLDVMFTLMHQGGKDTHEEPGSEIWVFNREARRRIARMELETPGTNIFVTQNSEPMLAVSTESDQIDVFDARTTVKLRTIVPGLSPALFQDF